MLIDRSSELGLVERRVSTTDKRCTEIHLLPKGEALAEAIAWQHRPELSHLQQELPLAHQTPHQTVIFKR